MLTTWFEEIGNDLKPCHVCNMGLSVRWGKSKENDKAPFGGWWQKSTYENKSHLGDLGGSADYSPVVRSPSINLSWQWEGHYQMTTLPAGFFQTPGLKSKWVNIHSGRWNCFLYRVCFMEVLQASKPGFVFFFLLSVDHNPANYEVSKSYVSIPQRYCRFSSRPPQ